MRISDWSSDVCSSDLTGSVNCPALSVRLSDPRPTNSCLDRCMLGPSGGSGVGGAAAALSAAKSRPASGDDAAEPCPTGAVPLCPPRTNRSEEHTTELQSLTRHPYAVFCLKNKRLQQTHIVSPTPVHT